MKSGKVMLTMLSLSVSSFVMGQDLPKPSPMSKVEQMVGLNKINIEYSRPSAKGRVVFGELVPFGENWRLGANASTKITLTEAITIEKTTIKPGTYAMYGIPSKDAMTVVFTSDLTKNGADDYEAKDEVCRVVVKAKENTYTETLTIETNNVTASSGTITIIWEKMRFDVPFTMNTDAIAERNIENAIKEGKELELVYYRAAAYYFDAKNDMKMANKYIEMSIKEKKMHSNVFMQARIAHAQGNVKEAIKLGTEALELANKAESKGWANYISGTLEDWKKK
jgi:hypothetical protein